MKKTAIKTLTINGSGGSFEIDMKGNPVGEIPEEYEHIVKVDLAEWQARHIGIHPTKWRFDILEVGFWHKAGENPDGSKFDAGYEHYSADFVAEAALGNDELDEFDALIAELIKKANNAGPLDIGTLGKAARMRAWVAEKVAFELA